MSKITEQMIDDELATHYAYVTARSMIRDILQLQSELTAEKEKREELEACENVQSGIAERAQIAGQKLAGMYAAEKKKNRWIPVGEGLPKNGQLVIICTGRFLEIATWMQNDWGVTHWRPIDLPEKDEVQK